MDEAQKTNTQIASLNELTSPLRSLFKDAWSRLSRNKGAVVSLVFISLFFIVALGWLSPSLVMGCATTLTPACREHSNY